MPLRCLKPTNQGSVALKFFFASSESEVSSDTNFSRVHKNVQGKFEILQNSLIISLLAL